MILNVFMMFFLFASGVAMVQVACDVAKRNKELDEVLDSVDDEIQETLDVIARCSVLNDEMVKVLKESHDLTHNANQH